MRRFIQRMIDWLNNHTLACCAVCHQIVFRKDITLVKHNIYGMTVLCDRCYKKLYLPFSSDPKPAPCPKCGEIATKHFHFLCGYWYACPCGYYSGPAAHTDLEALIAYNQQVEADND